MTRGRKLLIVEDSAIVAMDLQHKLKKLGYVIAKSVQSGEDAVSASGEFLPDLVLMDIRLSGKMDGIEAADTISSTLDIPVLFMSAYSDEQTIERAKFTKNYGFLVKPFEERDLYTTIEMAMERSKFDRRLRESEKKYRDLFESSKDSVCVIDTDLNLVDVNNTMTDLFGYSHNEILGMPATRIFADAGDIEGFIGAIREKGFTRDFETSMRKRDGSEIICQVTANARWRGGSISFYQAIIRDITERKRAEATIEKSYAMMEKTMFDVVQAMSVAVESRDPYTAGHQRRVSELAQAIAETMQLTEQEIMGIRLAALIHDLGKISIPAEILSKPSRLSETEFKLIMTHPEVGYNILKDIEFPWPIREIVLQHHERIDGSGYPCGLDNGEILPESKILAVADVTEAMASHRPYRPSLGIAAALEEITKNSGILYDRETAAACIATIRERESILVALR
ncbi:MAG: PAS domain S-box protein [Spirochaetes bacterium]|nr:PAS domain S-box protein [Spirochaetota bacterium]